MITPSPDAQGPLSPGNPAPKEPLLGREADVDRLVQHLRAASRGRLQVAFVTGERGVGKSALAAHIRSQAEYSWHMVGVHVCLGGADGLEEMTRRIFSTVLRESHDKNWYEPIRSLFGPSVHFADRFGSQLDFAPNARELDALVRNFGGAVKNLLHELREANRAVGLVLILDDIDRLATRRPFADWLKNLIDSLATDGDPIALLLMVVGLEEQRQSLLQLNPSLARAFDLVQLRPPSDPDE